MNVAAVNCAKEKLICSEYVDVRSYPGIAMINFHHGMKTFLEDSNISHDMKRFKEWTNDISSEWRYLINVGNKNVRNIPEEEMDGGKTKKEW